MAGELLANDIDGKIDAVIVESSELREKIAATVLVGTSGSRVEKKGN